MTQTTRRNMLLGLAAGASVMPSIGGASNVIVQSTAPRTLEPGGRLTVNRERAYRLMEQPGHDAIFRAGPLNSQYLTNMRSVFADIGLPHSLSVSCLLTRPSL